MATTTTSLIVRYAETDAQGVVHHANYLGWFEEGRSDYLRQLGLHYRDFETDGFFVVVVEAEVRYRAPAFYEDQISIHTTLVRCRGKILEFTYQVTNATGTVLAEGRTLHFVLDRDKRPVNLPDHIINKIL